MGFYGTLLAPGGTAQGPAGMRTPSQGRTGNRVGLSNGLSFRGRGVEVQPPQYSAQLFRPIAHNSSFQPNAIILPGSDHKPLQNQLANPFEIPLGPAETLAHHLKLQAQAQVIHLSSISSPEHPESVFSFPIGYISDNQSPQERLATAQIQTLLWGYVLKQLPNHTSAPNQYQNMLSENWILIQQFAGDLIKVISSQNPERKNLYFLTLQSELADWNHIVGDGSLRKKVNFAKDQAYHAVHSTKDHSGFLLGTDKGNSSNKKHGFGSSLFTPRPNSPKGEHDEPIGDVVPKQETPQDTPDPIDAPGANKSETEIGDQPKKPDDRIGDDVPDADSEDIMSADGENDIDEDLLRINEELSNLRTELEGVNREEDELQTDQDRLRSRRITGEGLKKTIDALLDQIKPTTDQAGPLRDRINELEGQISRLRDIVLYRAVSNLWNLNQRLINLERELIIVQRNFALIPNAQELLDERDSLLQRRDAVRSEIDRLNSRINEIDEQLAEIEQQQIDLEGRIEGLERERQELLPRVEPADSGTETPDQSTSTQDPPEMTDPTEPTLPNHTPSGHEIPQYPLPPVGEVGYLPDAPITFDTMKDIAEASEQLYKDGDIDINTSAPLENIIIAIADLLERREIAEDQHQFNSLDRMNIAADLESIDRQIAALGRTRDTFQGEIDSASTPEHISHLEGEIELVDRLINELLQAASQKRQFLTEAEHDIRYASGLIDRIDEELKEQLQRLQILLPPSIDVPSLPPLNLQNLSPEDLLYRLRLERIHLFNLIGSRNEMEQAIIDQTDGANIDTHREELIRTYRLIEDTRNRINKIEEEFQRRNETVPRNTFLYADILRNEQVITSSYVRGFDAIFKGMRDRYDQTQDDLTKLNQEIRRIDDEISTLRRSGNTRPGTPGASEINRLNRERDDLLKERKKLKRNESKNADEAKRMKAEKVEAEERLRRVDELMDLRNR